MSAERLLLLIATTVAFATVTRTKSIHIRSVDLAEAINRTVCPIQVVIDENPDRVPRRIKMMKCAQEPNHWCELQLIPKHECCQHQHSNHQMECVEMRDTVLVYYESTKQTTTYDVSVGCSCMINESTPAPRVPDGPT